MLSRSSITEAVTESNVFPHWEGMRLVVTIVVLTSALLEMIWKIQSACSLVGNTYPISSKHSRGIFEYWSMKV